MDESETAIIATSHVAGAMNYPSSTQALFALIVMIIVLLFILVYCCWGTFSCTRHEEASAPAATEEGAGPNGQNGVRHIIRGPHTVIVPINNMIYVGDPETHQIYQIPMDRDKPPAYTDVFSSGPPPPYRLDTAASELSSSTTTHREQHDNRTTLPESPPAYDECLSSAAEELGPEQRSSDAAPADPQQQQEQNEVAVASEIPADNPASTATESSATTQEVQESPPPKTDLILTVRNLPQDVHQASMCQANQDDRLCQAKEVTDAPGRAQNSQDRKEQ